MADGVSPHIAALDAIEGQGRVREFLSAAVREGRLSHAYLFVGAPGVGKTRAALALAQCVVCPHGGDGRCGECVRVAHGTHPDVHMLEPESASGYLVSQVREVVEDVCLAPVRARSKVYVVQSAGLLRGAAANALLKTIEEPPAGVMFVLIARTVEAVLPTIASRCQQVPFRVTATDDAVRSVEMATGTDATEAAVALAVAGTPEGAAQFLSSPSRRQVRRIVVRTLGAIPRSDGWDLVQEASRLLAAIKEAGGEVASRTKEEADTARDYLSPRALKHLADAAKRATTARERSGMMEALSAAESLLRDVLIRCEGLPTPIVNQDVADAVERLAAHTDTAGVLAALAAVDEAGDDLAHNVAPKLVLETMLFRVKEALACQERFR